MIDQSTLKSLRGYFVGRAITLRGDDIDTDQIIPGRFLKRISFAELGEHAFADARQAARERGNLHPFDNPDRQDASILLVNRNFGCGSSREHAPQALHRRGIAVIVGESFGEIFAGNCVAIGMPCLRMDAEALARLREVVEDDGSRLLTVDLAEKTVRSGNLVVTVDLPEGARVQLLEGKWDATTVLLEAGQAIENTALSLPYLNGWA